MFDHLEIAPSDPILGLNDAFKKDPNPNKINLGVGVFQDEQGKTPTLECVRRAEAQLLRENASKSYLPIEGSSEYGRLVRELLFGKGDPSVADGRAVTAQSPGGSGALRLAGDLLKAKLGAKKLWVSEQNWANHLAIFRAAGLETGTYPYCGADNALDFDAMRAALAQLGPSDAVLFHTCCHNPTGVDPTEAQWAELAKLAADKGFIPLFDFAYQGFGEGVEQDAMPVRHFAQAGLELVICSSFSKNFGLYNERVGAITLLAKTPGAGVKALSQLKSTVRASYSTPAYHGGAVVTLVLSDPELAALWRHELDLMRVRIEAMRAGFVETLKRKGVAQDFSFVMRQRGMFSYSGLSSEQVDKLREKHSVYAVRSGRINVAGMAASTMDRLCDAVIDVLR